MLGGLGGFVGEVFAEGFLVFAVGDEIGEGDFAPGVFVVDPLGFGGDGDVFKSLA